MRCSLLIGGSDKVYLECLIRYLLNVSGYSFDITLLETIESYESVRQQQKFHVIALERAFYDELNITTYDRVTSQQIGIVRGHNHKDDKTKEQYMILEEDMTCKRVRESWLFKYQKASSLAEKIYAQAIKTTDEEVLAHQGHETKVVGCYSPMGGSGRTMISSVIASCKGNRGNKVLHLSLDTFMDYDRVYQSQQHYNLSDYSTYLRTQDNWIVGLEQMVAIDVLSGVHYFKAPSHMQDTVDFQADLLQPWITYVKELSDYDYIVIDFPSYGVNSILEILSQCDHKFIISRTDQRALTKVDQLRENLERCQMGHVLENALYIGNGLGGGQAKAMNKLWAIELCHEAQLYKEVNGSRRLNASCGLYKSMEVFVNEYCC